MTEWLVRTLIVTGCLAGLACLVTPRLARRPAVAHAIWLVVLLRLLMPPLPAVVVPAWVPVPILPVSGRIAESLAPSRIVPDAAMAPGATAPGATAPGAMPQSAATSSSGGPRGAAPVAPRWGNGRGVAVASPRVASPRVASPRVASSRVASPRVASSRVASPRVASSRGGPSGLEVALAIWIAGSVVVALRRISEIRWVGRRLRAAEPAPAWLRSEVDRIARALGIGRPPRIRVVAGVASPFVWGLGRTELVWPAHAARMSDDRWTGVLAHELAHVRRQDHRIAWLETVGGCVWWWNPVFHLVRSRMRQQAELACDAWAVWAVPGRSRSSFAASLIDVARLESRSARRAAAALAAWSGSFASSRARRAFERRLVMIVRTPAHRGVPLAALAAVIVLAAAVLPNWTEASLAGASPLVSGSIAFAPRAEEGADADENETHWIVRARSEWSMARDVRVLRSRIATGGIRVSDSPDGNAHLELVVKAKKESMARDEVGDRVEDHLDIGRDGSALVVTDRHLDDEESAVQLQVHLSLPRALAMDLATDVGSIGVESASGSVDLEVNVGSIELDASGVASVSATTGTGSVHVAGADRAQTVRLRSNVGSVTVVLPPGGGGSFDVASELGSVAVPGMDVTRRGVGAHATGVIGQGGPEYDVRVRVGGVDVETARSSRGRKQPL